MYRLPKIIQNRGVWLWCGLLVAQRGGQVLATPAGNQSTAWSFRVPGKYRQQIKKVLLGGALILCVAVSVRFVQKKEKLDRRKWISLDQIQPNKPIQPIDTSWLLHPSQEALHRHVRYFIDYAAPDKYQNRLGKALSKKLGEFNKKEMAERGRLWTQFLKTPLDEGGNTILHYLAQWAVEGALAGPKEEKKIQRGCAASNQLKALQRKIESKLTLAYIKILYKMKNNAGISWLDVLAQERQCLKTFFSDGDWGYIKSNTRKVLFSYLEGHLSTKNKVHTGRKKEKIQIEVGDGLCTLEAQVFQVRHNGGCMAYAYLPYLFHCSTQSEREAGLKEVREDLMQSSIYQSVQKNKTFKRYSYSEGLKKNFEQVVGEVDSLFQKISEKQALADYYLESDEQELLIAFIKDLSLLVYLQKQKPLTDGEITKLVTTHVSVSGKEKWGRHWWIDSEQVHVFTTDFLRKEGVSLFYEGGKAVPKRLEINDFDSPIILKSNNKLADYCIIERVSFEEKEAR